MKKLGIFISFISLLFVFSRPSLAQSVDSTHPRRIVLDQTEVIDHDYFVAADIVEIYGTINGDVYVAGGQIIINGTINGDLLAAGGQISIQSHIAQNARIVGGQIDISGTIGRNLTLGGGNVNLSRDLSLHGNLVGGIGNLDSKAQVEGDVTLGSGNATLGNHIGGNILAGVGLLRLAPDLVVDGDLTYYSQDELIQSSGSQVAGTITQKTPPIPVSQTRQESVTNQVKASLTTFFTFSRLMSLLNALIFGYIMVHFFPNFSYRLITTIEDRPGISALIGLITFIVGPILSLLLILPLITASLGLVILTVFGLILYFARIFFMYWLGARLLDRMGRSADKTITLFIGIGLYYALSAIAIVGPITIFTATIFGAGALLLTNQRAYLSGRKLKIF